MLEEDGSESAETVELGTKMAFDLIRAILLGEESAKQAAYRRLEEVWSQRKIDDLVINVEALFRMAAG